MNQRANWLIITVALLLAWQPVRSGEPETAGKESVIPDLTGEELGEGHFINSLLVDREFPVIGGKWGWEMFIDAPLNGEPDDAELTLRRAKLKYVRNLGNDWRLKLTGDYSRGGGLELSDNYVSYNGWKQTLLTMGISDPAFSLESVSQSTALTFMERGLPVASLAEGRSGNVNFLRRNQDSILSASLIVFNVSQDDQRDDGQGIVLHYVHSPIRIGHIQSVHLGGSFSYRWNVSEDGTRFRTRPEIATSDDYFVDTGDIAGADRVGRISLEASQVSGRFSWQSEVLAARVVRTLSLIHI